MIKLFKKLEELTKAGTVVKIKHDYCDDFSCFNREETFEHLIDKDYIETDRHSYVRIFCVKEISYEVDDITETLEQVSGYSRVTLLNGFELSMDDIIKINLSLFKHPLKLAHNIGQIKSICYQQDHIKVTVKVKEKAEAKANVNEDIESTTSKSPIEAILLRLKNVEKTFSIIHKTYGYLRGCTVTTGEDGVSLIITNNKGNHFNPNMIVSVIYFNYFGEQVTVHSKGEEERLGLTGKTFINIKDKETDFTKFTNNNLLYDDIKKAESEGMFKYPCDIYYKDGEIVKNKYISSALIYLGYGSILWDGHLLSPLHKISKIEFKVPFYNK